MSLTSKQKKYLRGLAHSLHPLVQIGKDGMSEAVTRKVHLELDNHELIKVKVGEGAEGNAKEMAPALSASVNAELVQRIGHIIVLYRRHRKEPVIMLPKEPRVTPAA